MKRFYYGKDGLAEEQKWVFCVDHDADKEDSGWIYRGPSYVMACEALSGGDLSKYDQDNLLPRINSAGEIVE